jgi:hypothetical protein
MSKAPQSVGIGNVPRRDKATWKRPPTAAFGDPTPEPLFESVGVALTAWENLEFAFAALFATFMHADRVAAGRVYGGIFSAGGRRDALKAAAEVEFLRRDVAEADVKAFESLVSHWEDAGSRRGDIAHGCVSRWSRNTKDRGYFLSPPFYSSGKVDLGGEVAYQYTSADVRHFATRFDELGGWAMAFYGAYAQKYGP